MTYLSKFQLNWSNNSCPFDTAIFVFASAMFETIHDDNLYSERYPYIQLFRLCKWQEIKKRLIEEEKLENRLYREGEFYDASYVLKTLFKVTQQEKMITTDISHNYTLKEINDNNQKNQECQEHMQKTHGYGTLMIVPISVPVQHASSNSQEEQSQISPAMHLDLARELHRKLESAVNGRLDDEQVVTCALELTELRTYNDMRRHVCADVRCPCIVQEYPCADGKDPHRCAENGLDRNVKCHGNCRVYRKELLVQIDDEEMRTSTKEFYVKCATILRQSMIVIVAPNILIIDLVARGHAERTKVVEIAEMDFTRTFTLADVWTYELHAIIQINAYHYRAHTFDEEGRIQGVYDGLQNEGKYANNSNKKLRRSKIMFD